MVHLPGLGKRRAELTVAGAHVPPAAIKVEVGFGDGNVPLYKRVKAPPPQVYSRISGIAFLYDGRLILRVGFGLSCCVGFRPCGTSNEVCSYGFDAIFAL